MNDNGKNNTSKAQNIKLFASLHPSDYFYCGRKICDHENGDENGDDTLPPSFLQGFTLR